MPDPTPTPAEAAVTVRDIADHLSGETDRVALQVLLDDWERLRRQMDAAASAHALCDSAAREVVRGWRTGDWRVGYNGDEAIEALEEALAARSAPGAPTPPLFTTADEMTLEQAIDLVDRDYVDTEDDQLTHSGSLRILAELRQRMGTQLPSPQETGDPGRRTRAELVEAGRMGPGCGNTACPCETHPWQQACHKWEDGDVSSCARCGWVKEQHATQEQP